MKKQYIEPAMEVVKIGTEGDVMDSILVGSATQTEGWADSRDMSDIDW